MFIEINVLVYPLSTVIDPVTDSIKVSHICLLLLSGTLTEPDKFVRYLGFSCWKVDMSG